VYDIPGRSDRAEPSRDCQSAGIEMLRLSVADASRKWCTPFPSEPDRSHSGPVQMQRNTADLAAGKMRGVCGAMILAQRPNNGIIGKPVIETAAL